MVTKIEKIVRMIRELSIIARNYWTIDVTQRQWRIGSAVLAVQSSKKWRKVLAGDWKKKI